MSATAATKAAPVAHADRISPRHFKALANLIQSEAGIKMPASKQTMLEGRLRKRVQACGLPSFDAYCSYVLGKDAPRSEINHLLNSVTTNKTDFFREPRHFEYLSDTLLPAYRDEGRRSIRCWSAACSTGAEPYTLAMVLDDFALKNGGPDYRVLATDIDSNVLNTGLKGIYPKEMVEPVSSDLRKRYVLEAKDPARGDVRIVPKLRQKVSFGRLNLMDSHYPIGEPVDVIFCRNVLIYFEKETQSAVVKRLCKQLAPGGFLFLGHSETINASDFALTTVGGTVFRKG
ncbi:protein-glutamate O-methyltransferase CheR [Erythrobacter sp. SCSIO 43205]|uniref:CheR family methyltransferase n=1 Tax=Erythrobacter sp. SCSIO 43205 TaxID=2779361 RepID=UPI001CA992ED|nr:protein-glutamate O-methyltransferase CheR [Erythrobacter sp. SCSIO 43205]UAB77857.1 protein-glutamate O-methyltransferase CheR [Erythrobacter sp. SCSIO 43205]